MKKYILDAKGEPQECEDIDEWANWCEKADRSLAHDDINDARISTVFLGIDHSFSRAGLKPPLLWETMIFSDKIDEYQVRYHTKEDALKGHEEACEYVRRGFKHE